MTAGGITFVAGGEMWRLYVRDASRIQGDWFIQMVAIGPRTCTVIVRTNSPALGATAARVFQKAREWLATGDGRACIFLDLIAEPR